MKLAQFPDNIHLCGRVVEYVEEFETYTTADRWTTIKDTSPTSVAGAGTVRQSELQLRTGATDNDEVYVSGTVKHLRFANDRPISMEWDANCAAVAVANYAMGLSNIGTADFLRDNGAGIATNFHGAMFYKVDGNPNWFVAVSNAATQTLIELTALNTLDKLVRSVSSAYQRFRVEFVPTQTTKADVAFFIDDVLVYKFFDWVWGAANVAPTFGVKAGDTNNGATMDVDYVSIVQPRR